MGVAGRFFVQLFGTTPCDFGAIMRWWLPVCAGSSSAPGYLLPFLSPGISSPGLSVRALPRSLHPSPTPPRPPFRGERAGGSWAVEIGMCLDARPGIRMTVVDEATHSHHVTSAIAASHARIVASNMDCMPLSPEND